MNDETPKTQSTSNPPPSSGTPPLPAPKQRPAAIRILGWIGLIFGGLMTASQVAQMVMGMSPGIAGLVIGLLIMFGSLSMAMPRRKS
jgi:predicted lipid-binding transport protein (Tim44 family)